MTHSFHLKQGDLVKVIAGKEKGKTGKVLKVLKERERAIVEKLNMVKRHAKPSKTSPQGGITEKESSIHLSNLMQFDEKSGKTLRIGARLGKDGAKVRILKRKGQILEIKDAK